MAWKALPERERKARLRKLKSRHPQYPSALEYRYFGILRKYLVSSVSKHMYNCLRMVPRQDDMSDILASIDTPDFWTLLGLASEFLVFNVRQWLDLLGIAVRGSEAESVSLSSASYTDMVSSFTSAPSVSPSVVASVDAASSLERTAIEEWAKNQVTLIRNADQAMLDKVFKRVSVGVNKGMSQKEIEEGLLADMPTITENRARLIARDQVAKLTAIIDRINMQTMGWETYVWSTAQDERVRGNPSGRYKNAVPSHYVLDMKVCRWDDPSVCLEGGYWVPRPSTAELMHPGEAIQCRCVALPNWDEMEWD